MTLDNSAKIGDIITSLEGLQSINQKAELASVIGAPATTSDNIATQITKLQDAKDIFADKIGVENTMPLMQMAESLVAGKRWASGTATPSSTASLTFKRISNTSTDSHRYIEVTNLSFKPSFIIVRGAKSGNAGLSVYLPDIGGYGEGVTLSQNYLANGTYTNYEVNGASSATVTETGFLLPVGFTFECTWIAFE